MTPLTTPHVYWTRTTFIYRAAEG